MEREFPKRRHPRLKEYDYSQSGYYHVIINAQNDSVLFSRVGRMSAPAENEIIPTRIGKVAEEQLLELPKRYPHVIIDKYVIMPDHIHVIIALTEAAGASPRPTGVESEHRDGVEEIICAYKSIVTRMCNKLDNKPGRKIFQTSFYDRVIRNYDDYVAVWNYIHQNPMKV